MSVYSKNFNSSQKIEVRANIWNEIISGEFCKFLHTLHIEINRKPDPIFHITMFLNLI